MMRIVAVTVLLSLVCAAFAQDFGAPVSSTKHTGLYSLVQKQAPDFNAEAVMPDGSFKEVRLASFRGSKYVLLFFYPFDFTFVCPSEILAFDRAVKEFEGKDVQVLGCSVDSKFTHLAWRNTPTTAGGIGKISFPLLEDVSHKIAEAYGVLLPAGMALRGTFLIDKEGVIRHASINDLPLGRSVDESLRLVDALQFHEGHGDVCPANWKKGQVGMKPTSEGVKEYLAGLASGLGMTSPAS